MKLVYYPLELCVDIHTGETVELIVEPHRQYDVLFSDYFCQEEGGEKQFALFDDEQERNIFKECELISSPKDLFYDKRSIQKKLFAELERTAEENMIEHVLCELHGEMVSQMEQLNLVSDYELEYSDEFDMNTILKNFDVTLKRPEGSFIERMMEYMLNMRILAGKRLFIFANCGAFLDVEDYEHLLKFVQYRELCVIFLENRPLELPFTFKKYIIDSDLCEIH